ncbi:MAG TPA: NAD(P)/FAD-dependent oxidoreductase, partial [Allosphingosinicella sp.]|nr:NAD(P)/FAD-dependent oxidoreductase [Allosphingosinicella sp.]
MTDIRPSEHVDVLIVGAGISGIDAAYHLKTKCPGKSWLILEARDAIGGTWDLFRYPGIRSDSDMYTLGFPFRPWRGEQSIADGGSIRDYVEETAREYAIDRQIRFGHRVTKAAWSSDRALWTVEVEVEGQTLSFTCGFLFLCSGYYDYAQGYRPKWPDE